MWMGRLLWTFAVSVTIAVAACGGDASHPAGGGDSGAGPVDGAAGGPEAGAVGDGQAGGVDAAGHADAAGPDADAAGAATMAKPTCSAPIGPADVSHPTTVVGDGTAASCTEQALAAAVAGGGVITFRCGPSMTIPVTSTIQLPIDKDTVIDGAGVVSLDGGGTTRVFEFNSPNYRATRTTVTLQNLSIVHGKATGTPIPTAPAPCSQGFEIDGSGGAIFVRDGVLHVVGVQFSDNHAASPGPDVGGGAIYAEGSLDVTVVSSLFSGNSGSNGGAIGSLNSDLTLIEDTFSNNQATGSGANTVTSACTVDGGESGNGGNSGAVGIDGGSDGTVTVCGCTFSHNSAGALGGALARTADAAMQALNVDQSTFDSNTAAQGGGAMYVHNCVLAVSASTISNNTAPGGGGIQADSTTVQLVNDTFASNTATGGLGGGLALFSGGGSVRSCTFAANQAQGGSGHFGAAIAGGVALTIDDTIFSANTSQDCGSPMACQDGSSTGSADLQWPQAHAVCTTNDTPCAAGTTFADPMLGNLAYGGGPTRTIAPSAGSPAIGAGTSCPPTDQRGQPRKADGCTIGAVEVGP